MKITQTMYHIHIHIHHVHVYMLTGIVPKISLSRKGMKAIAPAISVCSNARDMVLWMGFLLSGGRDSSGRIVLLDDVLAEILKPQVTAQEMYYSQIRQPRTPIAYMLDGYSLGLFTGHYGGTWLISAAN